jgi:hypothetical protein
VKLLGGVHMLVDPSNFLIASGPKEIDVLPTPITSIIVDARQLFSRPSYAARC